ncbi:MAG: DUF1971 domain-containing protein [Candidatus Lambdaproteobacteria bacterium]|nr:DUF1971 domain-containing protein [Candidatus Lambdaproteobacteria bacterium]
MASELPPHAHLWDISAHYNEHTVPRELIHAHTPPPGMWARIVVEEGELQARVAGATVAATPGQPIVLAPDTACAVEPPHRPVRFYVEYYHPPIIESSDGLLALGR